MEVNKIKQYIIWRREDLNLQRPSSKPHILPLANVRDIYIILILYFICRGNTKKKNSTTYAKRGLEPTTSTSQALKTTI